MDVAAEDEAGLEGLDESPEVLVAAVRAEVHPIDGLVRGNMGDENGC